jgi:hypothetical protein
MLDFKQFLIDYYSAFISAIQADGCEVYPFAYDWRLVLEQVAQDLDAHILCVPFSLTWHGRDSGRALVG